MISIDVVIEQPGHFVVFLQDEVGVPLTGQVDGDFTKLLALEGVESAVPVVVSEISGGHYAVQFIPNTGGVWYVEVASVLTGDRFGAYAQATSDGLTGSGNDDS